MRRIGPVIVCAGLALPAAGAAGIGGLADGSPHGLRTVLAARWTAAPQSARTGCAKVVFYGVKGSGENGKPSPMGPTVTTVADDFKADLGRSVSTGIVPVSYPAVSVLDAIDDGLISGINYQTSRARGVKALSGLVSQQLQKCPATWVVLAGFSQGADVVGQYLSAGLASRIRSRIAAVALLGDPRFNPADKSVDAGSFNPKFGPILGKFGFPPHWRSPEGRRAILSGSLGNRTISACDKGDLICNYSITNAIGCLGLNVEKTFLAAILSHKFVPIPEIRKSCAHFHYADRGLAVPAAGQKVTATAVGHFLAAKVATVAAAPGGSAWAALAAPLPSDAAAAADANLSDVACATAGSCVAVGAYTDKSGKSRPLLLAGAGTSWTAETIPEPANSNGLSAGLRGVTCPVASRCVAVGSYIDKSGDEDGMLLSGFGSAWQVTEAPLPQGAIRSLGTELDYVSCPTGNHCLAVGFYNRMSADGEQGLLEWGSGSAWTASQAPIPSNAFPTSGLGDLIKPACPSTSECVTFGDYILSDGPNSSETDSVSGAGNSWTGAEVFGGDDAGVSAVTCQSASQCVATVTAIPLFSGPSSVAEFLEGAGSGWEFAASPLPGTAGPDSASDLVDVTCPTARECVAAGSFADTSGKSQGLLVTGSGTSWTAVQTPAPANSAADPASRLGLIACQSATACVSIGQYTDSDDQEDGLLVLKSSAGLRSEGAPLPLNAPARNTFPQFTGLTCTATSACVAVGNYTTTSGHTAGLIITGRP